MKEVKAYKSDDGRIYYTWLEALEADKTYAKHLLAKRKNQEMFETLKVGDNVQLCFTDTGGGVVWSYCALINKDKNGQLYFESYDKKNNARHDLVSDVAKYGRFDGPRRIIC